MLKYFEITQLEEKRMKADYYFLIDILFDKTFQSYVLMF